MGLDGETILDDDVLDCLALDDLLDTHLAPVSEDLLSCPSSPFFKYEILMEGLSIPSVPAECAAAEVTSSEALLDRTVTL